MVSSLFCAILVKPVRCGFCRVSCCLSFFVSSQHAKQRTLFCAVFSIPNTRADLALALFLSWNEPFFWRTPEVLVLHCSFSPNARSLRFLPCYAVTILGDLFFGERRRCLFWTILSVQRPVRCCFCRVTRSSFLQYFCRGFPMFFPRFPRLKQCKTRPRTYGG